MQNGELIYGCKDARSPAVDWRELAHHLKPFFYPSNGLASGPHCARAVIRELVRVITRVLLSGSDKGRTSALKLGPGSPGPCVCEASPFSRSLRHQGRLMTGGWAEPGRLLGSCLASRASAGAAWAPQVSPEPSSVPLSLGGEALFSSRCGCVLAAQIFSISLSTVSVFAERFLHTPGPSSWCTWVRLPWRVCRPRSWSPTVQALCKGREGCRASRCKAPGSGRSLLQGLFLTDSPGAGCDSVASGLPSG